MTSDGLFRWKRATPKKTDTTGVRNWIKRVQTISDEASREVLGGDFPGYQDARMIQPDDQALYEAQELLDKWVQDKHVSDINLELEFQDESWSSSTKPILNSKRLVENDNLDELGTVTLSDNGKIILDDKWHANTDFSVVDEDDVDYEQDVKEMFKKFMDRPSIEPALFNDLGMDKVTKKFKDPRPKMEQRQKIVKERNQERQKKKQETQRELMMKKEAMAVAKKKLINEEKARQIKIQSEEEAVQKEMARIRKEMEEERNRHKEEQNRRQKLVQEAQSQVYLEEKKVREIEREKNQRRLFAEEKTRKHILNEMEEKSIMEASENMKILHKHFSAWYKLIVAYRVKVGKARAVSDWRCKLRAWNAWRAYVLHVKSDKEAQEIAVIMKKRHRREQMGINHFRLKLLRKCFAAWQIWISDIQRSKQIKEEHLNKAAKMASFLEAAATGKLWGDETISNQKQNRSNLENQSCYDMIDEVEELFLNESKSQKKPKHEIKKSALALKFPQKNENAWVATERRRIICNDGDDARRKEIDKVDKKSNEKIEDGFLTNKNKDICKKGNKFLNKISKDVECSISSQNKQENNTVLRQENDEEMVEEQFKSTAQKELVVKKPSTKSNKPTTKPARLAMEERAEQRAKRKAILDERRKQQDEVKLEQLRLEQEKLQLAELQLKNERIQQKKEEKRIQKEREMEKQKRIEAYNASCRKADDHYNRTLLKRAGIEPWKRLIQIRKLNNEIAEKYHQRNLFRFIFYTWHDYAVDIRDKKNQMCQNFYQYILKRKCFHAWTKYGQHFELLENLARRHWVDKILQRYFTTWQHFVTNERLKFWSNEETAEEHNNRRLLQMSIKMWKGYITELKDEKEKEKRKNELRKRVREWLPDFKTL